MSVTDFRLEIFKMYIGHAPIRHTPSLGESSSWGVINDGGYLRLYVNGAFASADEWCLLLKCPFNELSLSDAAGLAEVLYGPQAKEHHIELSKTFMRCLLAENANWTVSGRGVACIDYMRTRGYAIPYNGWDLFEAGHAIKIEK